VMLLHGDETKLWVSRPNF